MMRKGTQEDLDLAAVNAQKLPFAVTFYHRHLGVVWRTAGMSNDARSVRFTNALDETRYIMPSDLRLDTGVDTAVLPVPPEEPIEWVPEPEPVPPTPPTPVIPAPCIPAPVVRDATTEDILNIKMLGKASNAVRYQVRYNEPRICNAVVMVVHSEHLAPDWVYVLGTKYPIHLSDLKAV